MGKLDGDKAIESFTDGKHQVTHYNQRITHDRIGEVEWYETNDYVLMSALQLNALLRLAEGRI